MSRQIDFWFSAGSTYTYLSVMRLPAVEKRQDIKFRLRPFFLGMLFKEMKRAPFLEEPQKMGYMWRDIERRSRRLGLQPKLPAPYPAPNSIFANRLAYVALREPWGREFLINSYRAWFEDGHLPGEEPNVSNSLRAAGQSPDAIKAEASKDEVHEVLLAETDTARSLGIFGSPTFVVSRELFWGDDRLEDAIEWASEAHAQ